MNSESQYPEYLEGQDFTDIERYPVGSRTKKKVRITKPGEECLALFKYRDKDDRKFRPGEDCAEKIASEIARVLEYPAARVELARGVNGEPGILSFLFTNAETTLAHAVDFIPGIKNKDDEKNNYTIEKIRKALRLSFPLEYEDLFMSFIAILVFDTLVDESDRHGENWGVIEYVDRSKEIAPIYDTSACLLRDLANEKYLNNKFLSWKKPLEKKLSTGRANIYKEDIPEKYNHFEMLDYLLEKYRDATKFQIKKLKRLTDEKIEYIIEKMPSSRMASQYKNYLKKYIKMRRDIIISKGE